jgi:hypothetical protein
MQTMEVATWTDYKALLASKTLTIQYSESPTWYELYAPEATAFMWHISLEKGTADATDFETNFKPTANAPMMINGYPAEAPTLGESQLFTNEAIRDTAAHNSTASINRGYRVKTVIVQSTLNQDATIQCQGSRDNSTWINIGSSWPVTAGVSLYQSCDTYFPYMRAVATCSVAPASGTLNMWLEKVGV